MTKGIIDTIVRRGEKTEFEPCNAGNFKNDGRSVVFADPSFVILGEAKIINVNVKDKVVTTDGLPKNLKPGDLVIMEAK